MHATQSFMLLGTALSFLFGVATSYTLAAHYDISNFFDEFSFFTSADPTYGNVDYVSQEVAANSDLIGDVYGLVYLGVDAKTYNPPGGRASVRLSSNQAFGQGLFIADIQHMPNGCGTWPAFWMFGPNWPYGGEIDIIEGVNGQSTDSITLHTSPGCVVSNANSEPGTFTITSDCSTSNSNVGCSVGTGNPNNFGAGFNAVLGGTYAMQWAGSGIYVWFWERGTVPEAVTSNPPNVEGWGQPLATFTGDGCDFDTYFSEQNIIFDTTFCGSWAGAVWGQGQCAGLADTCSDYVAYNPAAFDDAYWIIRSVQVYQ